VETTTPTYAGVGLADVRWRSSPAPLPAQVESTVQWRKHPEPPGHRSVIAVAWAAAPDDILFARQGTGGWSVGERRDSRR
jgi:hypothetical protein